MGWPHRPHAFICHAFARPPEMKQNLVESVARSKRQRLEQLLDARQRGMRYQTLADAVPLNTSGAPT